MKLRGIIVLALALLCSPVLAQVNPGTSPLSIAKGGTGGATASAARTALGLAIGTNVEAWDADLDCLAVLSSTGVIKRTGSGTCSAGTIALTDIASLFSGTSPIVYNSGTGAFSCPTCNVTGSNVSSVFGRTGAVTAATNDYSITQIAGLGSGVSSALQNTINSASGLVSFNGALGTPTSGVGTNLTGTAAALTAGNVTTNANLTGPVTSVGNATTIAAGAVTYANIASGALATAAQYMAGTASTLVASNIAFTSETTTTFGATTTFDFSTFINTAVTLTGNITTQTLSNVKAGQAGTIAFIQDGTGSRTTAWNSTFKFAGGVTPTLSTAAAAIDILAYSCRSSSNCVASLILNVK